MKLIPKKHSNKLQTIVVIFSSLAASAQQFKPDLMSAIDPTLALAIIGGLAAISAALVNYKQKNLLVLLNFSRG